MRLDLLLKRFCFRCLNFDRLFHSLFDRFFVELGHLRVNRHFSVPRGSCRKSADWSLKRAKLILWVSRAFGRMRVLVDVDRLRIHVGQDHLIELFLDFQAWLQCVWDFAQIYSFCFGFKWKLFFLICLKNFAQLLARTQRRRAHHTFGVFATNKVLMRFIVDLIRLVRAALSYR